MGSLPAKKTLGLRDWLFLTGFGLAVFAASRFLLPGAVSQLTSLAPVAFDESVLAETDPFVADVRAARQLVEQRYAYLEHRETLDGLDLQALESAALAEVRSTNDEPAFRRAMRRFVAGLHDGHGHVAFSEYRLPSNRHWPFTALLVAEGVMIDGVHPDAADTLRRGDLILTVNGLEIDQHITERALEVCASTDAARRRSALTHLTEWAREPEIELRLMRPGHGEVQVSVACPLRRLEIPTPGVLATDREASMLDGGVAFFRPGTFSAPEGSGFKEAPPEERDSVLSESYAELAQTLAEFADARALILDLRGNPGGTDLLGQALASLLLQPGYTYYHLSSQQRHGWSDPRAYLPGAAHTDSGFYGRLVCLIDEYTFSTADNLAACLRDQHPNVTFVGRGTGAGTGAPRAFELPRTGTRVTFCTMRVLSPAGFMIEGIGVAPDLHVLRTRDDVLAGRDAVLQAAVELLAN